MYGGIHRDEFEVLASSVSSVSAHAMTLLHEVVITPARDSMSVLLGEPYSSDERSLNAEPGVRPLNATAEWSEPTEELPDAGDESDVELTGIELVSEIVELCNEPDVTFGLVYDTGEPIPSDCAAPATLECLLVTSANHLWIACRWAMGGVWYMLPESREIIVDTIPKYKRDHTFTGFYGVHARLPFCAHCSRDAFEHRLDKGFVCSIYVPQYCEGCASGPQRRILGRGCFADELKFIHISQHEYRMFSVAGENNRVNPKCNGQIRVGSVADGREIDYGRRELFLTQHFGLINEMMTTEREYEPLWMWWRLRWVYSWFHWLYRTNVVNCTGTIYFASTFKPIETGAVSCQGKETEDVVVDQLPKGTASFVPAPGAQEGIDVEKIRRGISEFEQCTEQHDGQIGRAHV